LAAGLDQALQGPLATAEVERARNPEWTLMADLFSVLAWSNAALADPAREAVLLEHMDSANAATRQTEAEGAQFALLLPYARRESFRDATGRSVFVDGELALMLAARLSVARDPELEDELRRRVGIIESALARSPTLSAESYPNECWTFCNTTALAALVLSDRIFGTDHGPLARAWVELAKRELLDPQTGLLISSYTYEGEVLDSPEGTSSVMVAAQPAADRSGVCSGPVCPGGTAALELHAWVLHRLRMAGRRARTGRCRLGRHRAGLGREPGRQWACVVGGRGL